MLRMGMIDPEWGYGSSGCIETSAGTLLRCPIRRYPRAVGLNDPSLMAVSSIRPIPRVLMENGGLQLTDVLHWTGVQKGPGGADGRGYSAQDAKGC